MAIKNQKKIRQIDFGTFGVQTINQHPFWYSESLAHVFINQPLFLRKNNPLYPDLNYLLGIGI